MKISKILKTNKPLYTMKPIYTCDEMKAKELIKILKEVPEDTEVVLWKWSRREGKSVYRQLTITCNHYNEYNQKKKQLTLTVPELPRPFDPVYLNNEEN